MIPNRRLPTAWGFEPKRLDNSVSAVRIVKRVRWRNTQSVCFWREDRAEKREREGIFEKREEGGKKGKNENRSKRARLLRDIYVSLMERALLRLLGIPYPLMH